MRKISNSSDDFYNGAVLDSLSAIKQAHLKLRLLMGTSATAALLSSQIQLYDLLLDEISSIHASLARDIERTCLTLQVSAQPDSEHVTRLH